MFGCPKYGTLRSQSIGSRTDVLSFFAKIVNDFTSAWGFQWLFIQLLFLIMNTENILRKKVFKKQNGLALRTF